MPLMMLNRFELRKEGKIALCDSISLFHMVLFEVLEAVLSIMLLCLRTNARLFFPPLKMDSVIMLWILREEPSPFLVYESLNC
jgi:hypothetical protein